VGITLISKGFPAVVLSVSMMNVAISPAGRGVAKKVKSALAPMASLSISMIAPLMVLVALTISTV
jgi:hypothetical protein